MSLRHDRAIGWLQSRVGLQRTVTLVMGYWSVALGVVYIIQPESVRERTALWRTLVEFVDPRVWGVTMALAGLGMLYGAARNRVWIAQLGTLVALGAWAFSATLYVVDWQRSWPQVFIVGIPVLAWYFLTWAIVSQRTDWRGDFESLYPEDNL